MFKLCWTEEAATTYNRLRAKAQAVAKQRGASGKRKASPDEGLFKQVHKCLTLLESNPRHPGLQTHAYRSLTNPFDSDAKVFEAYVQNRTPRAYRVFWCYGSDKQQLTILAITPHP